MTRTPVWAPPVSLAATLEIDVSFFSSGYLDVSVRRVPLRALWIHARIRGSSPRGFPHSDTCGSSRMCRSPQLFAACRVFHRLPVPRHPPCALSGLTLPPVRLAWRRGCSFFFSFFLMSLFRYSVFRVRRRFLSRRVGLSGLEPPTSRLSGVRSNRLSYKPRSSVRMGAPFYFRFLFFFFVIRRPPAFPRRLQRSILGRPGLNLRVRDGYGCSPRTHHHRIFPLPLDNPTAAQPLLLSLERR